MATWLGFLLRLLDEVEVRERRCTGVGREVVRWGGVGHLDRLATAVPAGFICEQTRKVFAQS